MDRVQRECLALARSQGGTNHVNATSRVKRESPKKVAASDIAEANNDESRLDYGDWQKRDNAAGG